MNCISGATLLACLIACSACGAPASETDSGDAAKSYSLHYTVSPDPAGGTVSVSMELVQDRRLLREMSFSQNGIATRDLSANGELDISAGRVTWRPDKKGGRINWQVTVSNQRNNGGFDARLNDEWGIFRAEDIIPRATSRTLVGATSSTTLSFELPPEWSAITEYSSLSDDIVIDNETRRFDQPTGWIAMGELGVRRETIAGTRIVIAAPEGQSTRRMDMLALLNWTLPELRAIVPELPPRLTIISADDPMWRGGLSAPASIFIHSDRPLISENATSTLLHEVVHVALSLNADRDYDWITEGLAEYYSLQLLQRGGAITARRYKAAMADESEWAKEATELCSAKASGATTALAVVTFRQLDEEIRAATKGASSLDDFVTLITSRESPVEINALNNAATELLGRASEVLHSDNLPGCRKIAATP